MTDHGARCVGMRVCKRCGPRPVLAFAIDDDMADGLRNFCRDCESIMHHFTPNGIKAAEKRTRKALMAQHPTWSS